MLIQSPISDIYIYIYIPIMKLLCRCGKFKDTERSIRYHPFGIRICTVFCISVPENTAGSTDIPNFIRYSQLCYHLTQDISLGRRPSPAVAPVPWRPGMTGEGGPDRGRFTDREWHSSAVTKLVGAGPVCSAWCKLLWLSSPDFFVRIYSYWTPLLCGTFSDHPTFAVF